MAYKCLVKMEKAFNSRAHIILSEVQESTGCLGSCSLCVEEHYGCLEIWIGPGSLCVCLYLFQGVSILPGWWYVFFITSGVCVACCSAFSGVQTDQNCCGSPVSLSSCPSPGFHLMVPYSCGWTCLAILFHCDVCATVIKETSIPSMKEAWGGGMEFLCLLWMPRAVYLPTASTLPCPAHARLCRVHCGKWYSWHV